MYKYFLLTGMYFEIFDVSVRVCPLENKKNYSAFLFEKFKLWSSVALHCLKQTGL